MSSEVHVTKNTAPCKTIEPDIVSDKTKELIGIAVKGVGASVANFKFRVWIWMNEFDHDPKSVDRQMDITNGAEKDHHT